MVGSLKRNLFLFFLFFFFFLMAFPPTPGDGRKRCCRETAALPRQPRGLCISQWSSWTSSIHIIWELTRNAVSRAPPQTFRFKNSGSGVLWSEISPALQVMEKHYHTFSPPQRLALVGSILEFSIVDKTGRSLGTEVFSPPLSCWFSQTLTFHQP